MAEQRLPDGFRHLPTVPRTGRATELLPRILLTKCPDTLRKSHSKRKKHLVSQPCSKGLSAQKLSKASLRNLKHPNFGRFLVQEDHLAKLQFPKTVLAPGGDTGQHDVGIALKALEEKSLVTEEKDVLASLNSFWEDSSLDLDPTTSFRNEGIETSQELYPSVCRSWAAQQAYCRSLMSSRNESRMNTPNTRPITSRSDAMVTELCPQHRREALQHSFAIFPEEVSARLKDLRRRPVGDYHIDLPDPLADDSGSSQPQSSATNLSYLEDVKPHPVPVPKRKSSKSGHSDDSDRSVIDARNGKGFSAPETLEELRDLVQGAQLNMVPFKEQPSSEFMTLTASHSDLPDVNEPEITSPREELLRAVKLLNIFRWFCRLPAVHIEEDEAEVCDFLSDALLLRQPVYLPESHHIARRVLDLGYQLGGYLAKGDSTIMLHKESSLISAISVGMLCSHTVGWSYASAPAPGQNAAAAARVCLKEEMMQRAARHCDWHAEAFPQESPPKGGFATWMSFSKMTEPVVLQNLPDAFAGYCTLFEISDQWMAKCSEEPKVEKNLRPEPPARPRTNGSSSGVRSRPGTVGTVGTVATTSREDRPTTSSSRVRQVLWGSSETAKRREWSRACNLSWGDRSKSMMLRRKLLNPKLRSLGGSRVNDTCILRAPHSADANKEEEPDFVIFPPEGVCPMELLVGCHLPTWTIMPDSGQYQPSHSLQVRMWRVRLLRRSPTESPELDSLSQSLHRRLSKYSSPLLPEEPPYDAIRLEELPLSFLTCDCSAEGNFFCIIFRPHLTRICEGDQIEVELSGLSGSSERHHFFHDFRSCAELEWQDHEFFEEIQKFCKLFSDIDAFKGPRTFPKSLSRSLSMSMPKDGSLPELRPISHLNKDFKTDDIELSMYFYCVGVAAFEATLYLQRSDGEIKVERSTSVYHLDDYFLVRVKLPCSVSKYELGFRISTNHCPRKLVDYPLRYGIRSLESRSFPLTAVEDPPSQKYQRYGFCPVPPAAHLLGLTILAPMEYGLSPGSLYFLVHVHPRNLPVEVPPEPVGEVHPTELFARLRQEQQEVEDHALEKEIIKQKDPLFSDDSDDTTRLQDLMQRRSFQNAQRMMLHRPSVATMDPTINVMRRLHHGLEHHLSERTQDLPQNLHFDLMVREGRSNKQRFAVRLTRKLGHPEFYEGVLHFADHDPGAKIELYYRITEEVDRAPLKVAEWRVGRIDTHLDDD